jgi:hypothetical protein
MFASIRRWFVLPARRRQRLAYQPQLEGLEVRAVPATINVPFRVNTFTAGNHIEASNASNAAGSSVVVWARVYSAANIAIRAQVLSPSGTKVGGEIGVTTTAAPRRDPTVAVDGAGNFVVAWQEGNNIVARRFNATGMPRGNQFLVASSRRHQFDPQVASDARGNFIVAYDTEFNTAFTNGQTLAVMYNSAGTRLRTVTVTTGGGDGNIPVASSIAETANGRFVVGVVATTLVTGLISTMTTYDFNAAGRATGNTQLDENPGAGSTPFSCAVSVDNSFNVAAGWQMGTGVKLAFLDPTGLVQNTQLVSTLGNVNSVSKDLTSNHAVITWGMFYAFTHLNTVFVAEYASNGVFFGQFALPGTNTQGSTSVGRNHTFLWTYVNGLPTRSIIGSQIVGRYRQFVV